MKKIITLLVIALFLWLTNASAEDSTWTLDETSSTWTLTTTSTWTVTTTSTWTTTETSTGTLTNSGTVITATGALYNHIDKESDKRNELKGKYAWELNTLKQKFKEKTKDKDFLDKKDELFKRYNSEIDSTMSESMMSGSTMSGSLIKKMWTIIKFQEKKLDILKKYEEKRKEIRKKYINIYKKNYGKIISVLDEEKVQVFINKIEELITTVNNTEKYSDETKTKLIAMLESYKELADARKAELEIEWVSELEFELDIESLLK